MSTETSESATQSVTGSCHENRVHGLIRTPRPFILELVVLSDVTFKRIPALRLNGERVEAWYLSIQQFGDKVPTIIHVWSEN